MMEEAIEGMESVVATVSGYQGSERFNLIKLISRSGASYVGAMSKSTTHLVCWKFEGRKYELAKKFKTIIVNHRWVEDCIKHRKRLHENPYMLFSGEEVGTLALESLTIDRSTLLNKDCKMSGKCNIDGDLERQVIDLSCEDSGIPAWTDSFLLNENFFPETGKSNCGSCKSKVKKSKKTSKQGNRSRYFFQDPPLMGLDRVEHGDSSSNSSMHSTKEKRKISAKEESSSFWDVYFSRCKRKISAEIGSTSSSEPSRRGRRLVKKDGGSNNLEALVLDLDQDHNRIGLHNKKSRTTPVSECVDVRRNIIKFGNGETPHASMNSDRVFFNEAFDDIEEICDWNHVTTSRDLNSGHKDAMTSLEKPDECSSLENLNGKLKYVNHLKPYNRLSNSMELSCVICWTEFSSTRGILPCGHRFCYSCIQKWADRMALERKMSTCPLCKASFMSITKVEDAGTSDQKIYSQTIPFASSASDIFILMDQERVRSEVESSSGLVCSECQCREPEDLLVSCHLCRIRCIHSYCLDPPLLPWTCIHCKDLQMLYHHDS